MILDAIKELHEQEVNKAVEDERERIRGVIRQKFEQHGKNEPMQKLLMTLAREVQGEEYA